jgi:hypothetical protein
MDITHEERHRLTQRRAVPFLILDRRTEGQIKDMLLWQD